MTTGIRRSKAMPTDGPTAKFLYTIIKQLDLKSIDWNLVASQLEISNGHAARMRYSRFRQQMEGTTSTPRSSRPKKTTSSKSTKGGFDKAALQKRDACSPQPGLAVKQENPTFPYQSNPYIKADPYSQEVQNLAEIPHAASAMIPPQPVQHQMVPYTPIPVASGGLTLYSSLPAYPTPSPLAFHQQAGANTVWTPIKAEPDAGGRMNESLVKSEAPCEQ